MSADSSSKSNNELQSDRSSGVSAKGGHRVAMNVAQKEREVMDKGAERIAQDMPLVARRHGRIVAGLNYQQYDSSGHPVVFHSDSPARLCHLVTSCPEGQQPYICDGL